MKARVSNMASKTKVKARARRSADAIGKFVGVSEKGVRVGKLTTAVGCMGVAMIPGLLQGDNRVYSAVEILMGQGVFATATLQARAIQAFDVMAVLTIGKPVFGADNTLYRNRKIAGIMIASGITLTMIGKWINRYLGGSFIKL